MTEVQSGPAAQKLPSSETGLYPRRKLSRRQFLQALGVAAAGALTACAEAQQTAEFGRELLPTPTEIAVLESPQPPAGTPVGFPPGLERFLALSAAVTGVTNLDPRLGAIYLEALGRNPDLQPVETLYQQTGLEQPDADITMDALVAGGMLEQEPTRQLAREIARLWYTGTYSEGGETRVATYVDALAWKSLRFTKPASICGSFGFWATRPEVDVSAPGRAPSGGA